MNKIKNFLGELWCFFIHQWYAWEEPTKAYYPEVCRKCGRKWGL